MSEQKNVNDLKSKVGKKLGIIEYVGCGCLNIGCLVVIIALFAIVGAIIKVVTLNFTLGDIFKLFGYIWDEAASWIISVVKGK